MPHPTTLMKITNAIERIKKRTGKGPRVVTADRGYGEAAIEKRMLTLTSLLPVYGVMSALIPSLLRVAPFAR